MTNSFTDFVAQAKEINQQRFVDAQAQAQKNGGLAPMFCLPLVDACLKPYFDAGFTPEQALDAMDDEEEYINTAMCRAEVN